MSLTALLLSCIAILNLSIGVYVYRYNRESSANRAFGFMAIALSFWTVALAVAHYGTSSTPWPLRCAFASASLIPIGVIAFVRSTPFVQSYTPHRGLYCWFLVPLAIALSAASLSSWIVISVGTLPDHSRATYGPLHRPFAIYVLGCLAYAVYILYQKYRHAVGATRLQVRWLILAFAVPSALAVATNLAVPLFFSTSSLSKYGPFFTLPLLALIGHLILHHRLLDVRVVVRRSVVYLTSFSISGLVLVGLLAMLNSTIMSDHSIPIRETILALGVALFFGPLRSRIQHAANIYLYREPYDYQRTVREASRALRETIDLTEISKFVTGLVSDIFRSESVAVYVRDDDEGDGTYELSWVEGQATPQSLSKTSTFVTLAISTKEIAFREDLTSFSQQSSVTSDLEPPEMEILVPLVVEDDVLGLLCVGRKQSGDPYFSDDADLLATLANQSAISIRNAQTHQRVVQLNEELQKILSTIESGVVAIGTKGKIALFNPAAEVLTGVSADAARGKRVDALPAPVADLIAATLADGQPRSQIEFSLPDMAGQVRPLVCSTSTLESPEGRPMGAVAVIGDISILKQLEQERRRAERLASNEAIASGLVHEIRNPLVAVKTFCQLLPARYLDSEFREMFSRTVGREVRRIDTLLTRFRTLASVASQPMGPVDVLDPIRHTLDLLGPQFEERKVTIRRVFDGPPRRILGNTSQLEQLFLNLCLNALEAMGPGGELTLRVADLSDGGGTTLLVEVSDTGAGIPEDSLPKIFDPFVSTKSRSSGLGLAICRGVADAHHARLGARNNTDRGGATFTIEFPIPISSPAATP